MSNGLPSTRVLKFILPERRWFGSVTCVPVYFLDERLTSPARTFPVSLSRDLNQRHFFWVIFHHDISQDGGFRCSRHRVQQILKTTVGRSVNPAASPSLWPPTRYGGVFVRRCCCFVALRGVSVDRAFSYLWGPGSGLLVYAVKRPESRWNDFDADPSSAQQRPPATSAPPKSCTSTRLLPTAYLFRIPSFLPYLSDVLSLSLSLSLTLRRKPTRTCPPEKCQKIEWAWQREEGRRWAFSCCSEAEVNNS